METNKKPTVCLGIICKNEEKTIDPFLENVYKYIDYWIVYDMGSIDSTNKIITDFFERKNINGELCKYEQQSIAVVKTLMFERCYKKTDYVLHLETDMELVGEINIMNIEYKNYIGLLCKYIKDEIINKKMLFYNNNLRWVCNGQKNNIICIDNINFLKTEFLNNDDFYIRKFKNSEEKLLEENQDLIMQYKKTIIDSNSTVNDLYCYNIAMNYFDLNDYNTALEWLSLYSKQQKNITEELYVVYLKIIECMICLNYTTYKIVKTASRAILLFPDRGDHFYILALFFIDICNYDMAYYCFSKIKNIKLSEIIAKYNLNIMSNAYGNKINYLYAVACINTKRKEEAINLLKDLLNDNSISLDIKKKAKDLNILLENNNI